MAVSQADLVEQALRWLARQGVREVCVAAGARNAPLIGALTKSSGVTLRHFFEERCAGFFALGRTLATTSPIAVITTSGTAAAELLPAMIEAHYQGLPLIALTADRPKSHRGTGAPQAIEQANLFGPYAALSLDIDSSTGESEWERPIPLDQPRHLNLCLDEPLEPNLPGIDFNAIRVSSLPMHTAELDSTEILAWVERQQTPIVAAAGIHPRDAEVLAPFLASLGLPIFAEATSNLGHHDELAGLLVPSTDESISEIAPTAILRFGAVPSGRWWRDLESQADIAVWSLSRTGHPGLARTERVQSVRFDLSIPLAPVARARTAPSSPRPFETPPVESSPSNEQAWLQHLARKIPDQSTVFLGNSLPIREWNEAVDHARPFRTFANRGANGIDGLVSTFLGLSADKQDTESWLILGDLSALYDLAAPWILSQLPAANRRIVVLNNGGGRIFSKVNSLRELSATTRAMIENDHQLSFRPWAELWNISYLKAETPDQLQSLPDGALLIEIPTVP